jgi:O-succinylbenzoate synthase
VPAALNVPPLGELVARSRVVTVPLVTRFRGVTERTAVLVEGPFGWGEFAPFPEYPAVEAARWLAAAVEAGWTRWPDAARDHVPVNVIVPAVGPDLATELVRSSGGCRTAKVKVAEPGSGLGDDAARVAAVSRALEETGDAYAVRVDANGAWDVDQAARALEVLDAIPPDGLEYVEQPCATLEEQAELRRRVDVPLAADEGIRKAADPTHVAGVREAADVVVVKVAPLGGVAAALEVAGTYGLPAVVSSAIDTSVGLAAGVALAAALGSLPYACGLGSGRLLVDDVVADGDRLLPVDGRVSVTRPAPDPAKLDRLAAPPDVREEWLSRLAAAYAIMTRP